MPVATDFADGSLTGIVTIGSGKTSFTKTLVADGITEGLQTFVVNLRTGSASGPIVATSNLISVNDTSQSSSPPSLYSFTTFTFTNGGATGRTGPTSFASVSSYTSQSWYASYFSVTSGIQYWTAPQTGNYTIRAAGAAGQGGVFSTFCRGIIIESTISLIAGQQYKILIGQMGVVNGTGSGGGGGGTFMTTTANSPIIVAGGGGGAYLNSSTLYSGSDGRSTTSGANSSDGSGTGGSNGNGGTGSNNGWGGGGGGLTGDGTDAINLANTRGFAFINGGTGGNTATTAVGGFGGGAGTHGNTGGGGGGGGYSGGGGSNQATSASVAGGGGSYSQSSISVIGYNTGHGYLTVTKL